MKTYLLRAQLQEEADGRWSAWIAALPGCAAWGHSQQEALHALRDAAEAYVADMLDAGELASLSGVEVLHEPLVTVTI